jgi:hypothetical protein
MNAKKVSNSCSDMQETFNGFFDFLTQCPVSDDNNTFQTFLSVLKNHPTKVYYFTVEREKWDTFKALYKLEINEMEGVKVEFSWEFIRAFGTDEQKRAFNNFRRRYVNHLMSMYCKSSDIQNSTRTNACTYKVIGTPAISSESDMDFDLSGVGDLGAVLKRINKEHHQYFALELDELFDTNLYGSVFVYDEKLHNTLTPTFIETQNVWSWIRTIELLQNYIEPSLLHEFYTRLLDTHKNIYFLGRNKLQELSLGNVSSNSMVKRNKSLPDGNAPCNSNSFIQRAFSSDSGQYPKINRAKQYRRCLSDYLLSNKMFEEKVESFSLAKYYENETYRSLGAVLHIVNKLVDIDENYFVHSVYDQYGFVVENVLEEKIKGSSVNVTVPKASKYISRICDAIEKLNDKSTTELIQNKELFTAIKDISNELNDIRRTLNKGREKELTIQLRKCFANVLNISNSNANANANSVSSSQLGKVNFLLGVYNTLIKPVGVFQEVWNKKKANVRNNSKTTNARNLA